MSASTETRDGMFTDRASMTPCQIAFEKWWADNSNRFREVGPIRAWPIFRSGYWAGEESK